MGIVSSDEALRIAEERGLDLVKISPQAVPPVCKLMNYGKYRFDAEMIITINNDPNNKLFNISHYSILGDLYEVLPRLNDLLEGENHV